MGALREALETLVARHEALRTNFVEIDGSPTQIVHPAGPLELPLVDLSKLAERSRLAEAQRHLDHETRYRFDLANDRLLRPTLLRLGDEDHVIVMVFNHIIMDGWSLGVFNRELQSLYRALSVGERVALPELPLQPADIACWERQYFQTAAGQRQAAYWKSQCQPASLLPALPGDGPEPEFGDCRSELHSIFLPQRLVEGLRELGRQEGCTLSITLFAAANLLLRDATGQDEITVVNVMAARNRPEFDGLIGCFRKQMSLFTDLSGRPTYREVLRRVRDVALGAYLHLDVSQETVFPDRGVDHPAHWSRAALNFNFIELTASTPEFPGLDTTVLPRTETFAWGGWPWC